MRRRLEHLVIFYRIPQALDQMEGGLQTFDLSFSSFLLPLETRIFLLILLYDAYMSQELYETLYRLGITSNQIKIRLLMKLGTLIQPELESLIL